MDIHKIKRDGTKITIEWVSSEENAEILHRLTSTDPPEASFIRAFDELATHVRSLCAPGFTGSWYDALEVVAIAIAVDKEDSARRVGVTVRREIADGFITITLPSLHESCLSEGIMTAVRLVEDEAAAYVRGARAQGTLFETTAA